MNWSVEQLYQELLELGEQPRVEAKRASEVGASVMQSICAFANEPGLGGGWLLLGIGEPDEEHDNYWVVGVADRDALIGAIQNNCREQFERPIQVQSKHALINGKLVVGLFVPEVDPSSKPCGFKGKYNKLTKRKTGVWRRGLNGDYECSQEDLEPLLLAKAGLRFEQIVLADAELEDIDPSVIDFYRRIRAKVRPDAEELQVDDIEMLRSMNLIVRQDGRDRPNVACVLLFGKSLSLRRLLPAVRVDYVRVQGTQWIEDPEQRFLTTQDFREPLLRLIPRLETTILDDMPYHFRLKDGDLQRSDQPLLPARVVREAVVNAVMHRDYRVHQPTLIVRFSNRLEILNAGYSLKSEAHWSEMGSMLRNPVIANVLYDVSFAETKGSGIRMMRRLLRDTGLTAPVFRSEQFTNQFTSSYLLHQLLSEEALQWLQQFTGFQLSDDEAKALVLAREIGAIDNAALRDITSLDTLGVSYVFKRLCSIGLLEKGGAGAATYYQLSQRVMPKAVEQLALFEPMNEKSGSNRHDLGANASDLGANASDLGANASDLGANASDLGANASDLGANAGGLPEDLAFEIEQLNPRARRDKLWPLILRLCAFHPHSAEQLAKRLNRETTSMKTRHLNPMRKDEGLIDYLYPEVINHPEQAYVITEKGRRRLEMLRVSKS